MANAAGLLKGVPEPLFTVFGSRGEVKVKELHVGEEAVQDLTAIVMDHPTVQAISDAFEKKLGGPIDGIVGFPFFARFKMTLDYQAKTVTLLPNGYQAAERDGSDDDGHPCEQLGRAEGAGGGRPVGRRRREGRQGRGARRGREDGAGRQPRRGRRA